MNIVSFTAVGIRLLALLIFFYILRETSRFISLSTVMESYQEWPIAFLALVLFLCIGIFLWRFPVTIAKKIIPKEISIVDSKLEDFHRPIYQLAFVLFGLFVVIYGLSDLLYTAQVYVAVPGSAFNPQFVQEQKAAMVSSFLEIIIGVVLIVGARAVSNLIYKLRYSA